MQNILVLNPILTRKFHNEQETYLKSKICSIKPIVDSKCPESFYYLQNKYNNNNNIQKNVFSCGNWNTQKANMNAFKIIKFNSRQKKKKTKYRPLFKYDHDFLTYSKKEKLINVALENLNIYNRLNSKYSTYNLKNHLRDYDKAQYYKKNHCKFPSIDFYRTSKVGDMNLCSIFNYCTYYNYKSINDKFENELFKKTNSKIMYKNKSALELLLPNKNKKKKIFKLGINNSKSGSKTNKFQQKVEDNNINKKGNKIFFKSVNEKDNKEDNTKNNDIKDNMKEQENKNEKKNEDIIIQNNININNKSKKEEKISENNDINNDEDLNKINTENNINKNASKINDDISEEYIDNIKDEQKNNNDNSEKNKDNEIIKEDNNDMIMNNINYQSEHKNEEIEEDIMDINDIKKENNHKKENYSLKEDTNINNNDNNKENNGDEIEESIENEKGKEKNEVELYKNKFEDNGKNNEIIKDENKKKSEKNNIDKDDDFVSDILEDIN